MNGTGYEVGGNFLQHIVIAAFCEICSDDGQGILRSIITVLVQLFSGPEPQKMVSACKNAELHVLIMDKFGLECTLALIECCQCFLIIVPQSSLTKGT